MFGYVTASWKELSEDQQARYEAVYCGICRQIRERSGNVARLGLRYDMAFLSLLLMSLYEPAEEQGDAFCALHPIRRRPWVDNEYIRYAADMNVALCYYNCMDDWQDDRKLSARSMAAALKPRMADIEARFPRQCGQMRQSLAKLGALEQEKCPDPDQPAGAFGELMAQLLVYREDIWQEELEKMGFALGRFIYLLDAALDYDRDKLRRKYNPFVARGDGKDWKTWEEYLILAMARCTDSYQRLPLVQDKALLDNILYSGVWINYRGKRDSEEEPDGRSV